VAGLAVLAFLLGVHLDLFPLRLLSKPVPVLCLAWLAFTAGTSYGRRIGWGFLACVAGDILLELGHFLPGVGAFFAGHVLYITAFLGRTRALRPLYLLPFAAWALALVLHLRPGLEASGMLVPVGAYSAAIAIMMWRAAALRPPEGFTRVALFALVGAVLFGISDSLIALDRFQEPLGVVGRYAIILLYWAGQGLIGTSVWSAE
jgi:uncharacterized membrane protein YhhN